ncbi:hypothetical protein OKA04_12230 [Luteolibacter flavescens]|uniref:Uncharacterized protein n=1 Tax=Luteolibacter flavescens TaxID=1859460 RepID=A0ABT3FPL1_9BACT|nr:hypothetical protein [Luteolibacter flavescens]MCW1885498.1 hypothetical protein [Luteolibacter flavescens]
MNRPIDPDLDESPNVHAMSVPALQRTLVHVSGELAEERTENRALRREIAKLQARPAPPTDSSLSPMIGYLACLASQSFAARELLFPRKKLLLEAAKYLGGVSLLIRILNNEGLTDAQKELLSSDPSSVADVPDNLPEAIDLALKALGDESLHREMDELNVGLARPGISSQETVMILDRVKEINASLSGVQMPTIFTERFDRGQVSAMCK